MCRTGCIYSKPGLKRQDCCICSDLPTYFWCDACVVEQVENYIEENFPDHVNEYLDNRYDTIDMEAMRQHLIERGWNRLNYMGTRINL